MMLYKLLSTAGTGRCRSAVVVLLDKGKLGHHIERLGIPVYTVRAPNGYPTPAAMWRLVTIIRELQPDLIQAWMYHSNVAATAISPLLPDVPVMWNIRHTPDDLNAEKKVTGWLIRAGAWVSALPVRTIYNSRISAERHADLGYARGRCIIIPNGFDTDAFRPSRAARSTLRRALSLADDTLLIGMIARYHPMKDHANFVKAAAKLALDYPDAHFVLVGRRVNACNVQLMQLIHELELSDNVHLLGQRLDIPMIAAGLDVASLTSAWGEGFPNVIGEAMACGTPCVVTDVGDSGWVVGDTGIVVRPRDADGLASAWAALIELGCEERRRLGELARRRIEANFSLADVVDRYGRLYRETLGQETENA